MHFSQHAPVVSQRESTGPSTVTLRAMTPQPSKGCMQHVTSIKTLLLAGLQLSVEICLMCTSLGFNPRTVGGKNLHSSSYNKYMKMTEVKELWML